MNTCSLMDRFLAWCSAPLWDPPITGGGYSRPTGQWYIEHHSRPGSVTTFLSGHRTRRGAEYEITLYKKSLPWAHKGEWFAKPVSEYGAAK